MASVRIDLADLEIVPANQAYCDDLLAVFGEKGYTGRCLCQRFRTTGEEWWHDPIPREERIFRLRQQTDCGHPDSNTTSGLVAYVDGEPVGWCGVDQRSEFMRLGQTPWKGRSEDRDDCDVWAITCFAVRVGYRGRGVTYLLAEAAVEHARGRGAQALEGYPMIPEPGQKVTWGEIHVGHRKVFEAAGFREVSHPSKRRCVMRIDF
jgi:GNAT superfamily N-acetyltransferase